jgi:hypothetical protein
MTVIRISRGTFDLARLDEVEELLAGSEEALREPLAQLPGLLHFYSGIDRQRGAITNVSVWASLDEAHALDALPAMLAQRSVFESAGVAFEVITNHENLWTITP